MGFMILDFRQACTILNVLMTWRCLRLKDAVYTRDADLLPRELSTREIATYK